MFQVQKLKNGLTLITIPMPHLDSVTTLVAVGTGGRYEVRKNNGIAHFMEHMFFKGSKKYPTTFIINSLIDGIGAVNNAATSREYTYYWVKSAAKHIELASDVVSSMLKEPLLEVEEIEREKGVIIEEGRMRNDNPTILVYDLFEQLLYGNQPIGWDLVGSEKIIKSLKRQNFVKFIDEFYDPKNMALVYAGKIPKNVTELAEKYFLDLPKRGSHKPKPFKKIKQVKPKIAIENKKVDQANLILGVIGYNRYDPKRYAARVLATVLGEGMSSRLFIQVRERRGLAYHVNADHDPYLDTGVFGVYAGLKLEKVEEGLNVIKDELEKMTNELVSDEELKKAKELIRGRLALRSESTNFLAEHFGIDFILDRELETFEEYLKKIEAVTAEDVQKVAKELFQKNKYNLQIIGPFKSTKPFEKILNS